MADSDRRPQYYDGQFLQKEDFIEEQAYHLDRLRRHLRQLHTPGISEGLTVTAEVGTFSATVQPGTAIDDQGRPIVLVAPRTLPLGTLTGSVLVVISYRERSAVPATVGDEGDTRWLEDPDVEVIPDNGALPADGRIPLARLRLDGNGAIDQQDMSVRTSAGVKLGTEVAIERIRLSREGVASNLWPVLSSGAASQADVTGNLSVAGNLSVTGNGTVHGRDISADGAKLDTHTASTNNPHNTTAAQVQAITGVGGVLNPGGQVNLLAGNNLSITADNGTNKRITIASAKIAGLSYPGGDIAFRGLGGITVTPDNTDKSITFAGSAPSSIDGVSSPGGNIDFIGAGITVTPNPAAKTITFATSPAVIGALATADYLKRTVVSASFSASETTKTIVCGFPPKLISLAFTIIGFSSYAQAVYPTGFASINNTSLSSCCSRIGVSRFSNYVTSSQVESITGYLADVEFLDLSSFPSYSSSRVYITLLSVNPTGFVLKMVRSNSSQAVIFSVAFQIAILG